MQKDNQYLVTIFLNYIKLNNASIHTLAAYKRDLSQFMTFLGSKSCVDINNQELYEFYHKVETLKRSSVERKFSCIKSFYKFLFYEERICKHLPNIEFPRLKTSKKLPKTLTKEEVEALIMRAKEKSLEDGASLSWGLMFALLQFLYASGARISELLALKIFQIFNLNCDIKDEIIIIGKGSKERVIFLNTKAREAINFFLIQKFGNQNFLEKHSNLPLFSTTFGRAISRQRVFQLMKALAEMCNIDSAKVSPHVLRHSIAVHLLLNNPGANIKLIKEFLGHSSINTTQIYLNYSEYQKLSRLIREKHPLRDSLHKEQ